MAQKVEVSCIDKRDRQNPHERIQAIGGVHGGQRWKMSEESAIQSIKAGKYDFYVTRGGRTVDVIIATHSGREYLKTENDGYSPDNLLSLDACMVN